MTADKIFDAVLMLIFAGADEKPEYQAQFVTAMNFVLAETFEANNSIRVSKGLAELTEIPAITASADTIGYEDGFCCRVLPYGIAGLIMAEDNASMATQYKNKYEYEKANSYKAACTEIVDYYSQEE